MSDVEKRVHDAFDSVHAPAALRARTLEAIEAKRAQEERASSTVVADATFSTDSNQGGADAALLSVHAGERERRPRGARSRKSGGFRLLGVKIAVAACFILSAIGIGGFAVATPTAYVGIDVNPSIELGINRFDHVVETHAYNDDGQAVLDQAQVNGMPYADALAAIQTAMADQGYLSSDAVVEVNVVCDADDRYDAIESTCLSCFNGSGGGAHCSRASADEHHEASSCGMGMGKYRAYQALVEAGVDITAEEASDMTMRELYDLAQQNGVDVTWGCGSGHGYGGGSGCADDADDASAVSAGSGNGHGAGAEGGSGGGSGSGHGQGHGYGHGRNADGAGHE